MAVVRVTIHHQGAGMPSDRTGYSSEGYSMGIGLTNYSVFRPPSESWATMGHNGDSLDICLSGNRDTAAVTDNDLALVRAACADARARGWLTNVYTTYPHGIGHVGGVTNGASWTLPAGFPLGNRPTECPGVHTIERWPEIVAATRPAIPAPPATPPLTGYEMYIVKNPATTGEFLVGAGLFVHLLDKAEADVMKKVLAGSQAMSDGELNKVRDIVARGITNN
jgi:hypothetical protein